MYNFRQKGLLLSEKTSKQSKQWISEQKEVLLITSVSQYFVYLNKTTQHTGWCKSRLENHRIWDSFCNGRVKKISISSSTLLSNAIDSSLRKKYYTVSLLFLSIQLPKFPTISSGSSSPETLEIHSLCYIWWTNYTVRGLPSNSGSVQPVWIFVNGLRHEKFLVKHFFFPRCTR